VENDEQPGDYEIESHTSWGGWEHLREVSSKDAGERFVSRWPGTRLVKRTVIATNKGEE
jgi:hypothetical protein